MTESDHVTDDGEAEKSQTPPDPKQSSSSAADDILSPQEGHIEEADAQLKESKAHAHEASDASDTLDR